ncbi:MAG TPA: glycosyltransferase family 4 protein [Acidimicrobiales bacterium]|nr:glycosyltransferase family 4 protein [Acidimicrobiales bacterium]
MKRIGGGGGEANEDAGAFELGQDSLIEPATGGLTGYSPFDEPGLRRFADMSLHEIAAVGGLRRLDVVAWRDFDDPEAGGSELHAHQILSAWAEAGLDITLTTSSVPEARAVARRGGYRVVRRAGRYAVFPRTLVSGALGRLGTGDGLVEVWNGMPFFSPLWARCPRITFLHHVHAEMWNMVLPRGLAALGNSIEHQLAPAIYRRSRIVTLSSSSKTEIVDRLGIPSERVVVCPPGVDSRFAPGGERSDSPLVVAVGRLVPVKRFQLMIEALVRVKRRHPDLVAVIAGEGYERPMLEDLIRDRDAGSWISLPGYIEDDRLVDLYRAAWVVASSSLREGWGMTVTEAGACGTPSVASRISGHRDAVIDDRSGLLFDDVDGIDDALDAVISDEILRKRLGIGAFEHASQFTWDAAARGALAVLAAEALANR